MKQLEDNGMTVEEPTPELAAAMREATADMAGEFAERVPAAAEIIETFKAGGGGS
jgi:TRAP-type C4-dicarboxylate transport system substrate-binding protein